MTGRAVADCGLMLGLRVDDEVNLAMPLDSHAESVYALIEAERDRLERWLWVDLAPIRSVADQVAHFRSRRASLADVRTVSLVIEVGGEVAGTLGFAAEDRTAEIGYLLAQRYEGRGIVTRSVTAVIDAAIGRLGIHRFEIRCAPDNHRSRAIPERLGFRLEARLRDAVRGRDGFVDQELYTLLAPEWRA